MDAVEVKLEALKLIKDWSSGLLVVESAAIGVVGSLLANTHPSGAILALVVALFISLTFSIYIGAVCAIGMIPAIAQKLTQTVAEDPDYDNYKQSGDLPTKWPWLPKTLGSACFLQSRLFVLSLILFAVFTVFR